MAKAAWFKFYDELNDFLPRKRRKIDFRISFSGTPAVKDVIESLGVPHVEIDMILANGQPVEFGYRLIDGDRVSVYPAIERLDISRVTRLRPVPYREPRFILDVHLGRLARMLRLMGFDSLYRNDYDDVELAVIARNEKRIVLTRDVGLLKMGMVTHGYWVRATRAGQQAAEVLRRFDLYAIAVPFLRCVECNATIAAVTKQEILDTLEPKTARYFTEFYRCTGCRRVYWKGSHYERMSCTVQELLSRQPPR